MWSESEEFFFNSSTLVRINSGVKIRTREKLLIQNPVPNIRKNIPVNIGFREYAYGPVITNFGGGFTGTGVPFAFKKNRTDHPTKKKPTVNIRGIIIMLKFLRFKFGKSSMSSV